MKLHLPPHAVSQALRSLITNAQDASPPSTSVVVAVHPVSGKRAIDRIVVAIRDRGPGIPDDVLARIGEPFFTTKAPGRGMGLGLFLARAVIEGVGGTMRIDTRQNDGTQVLVELPCDVTSQAARIPAPTATTATEQVSKPKSA